jgi:hypothetical protein
LILILIVSSLLLSLTGSLTPAGSAILVLGGGIALFVINFRRHQAKHQLLFRSHELGATSAIAVRHLGGLPFPIPTPVNLFFTADTIRVETEHDVWQISRRQLRYLVIMSTEQIHKLPDGDIIQALSGGNSRLLSLIREKIRRGDSQIRHSKLLFLTLQEESGDDSATDIVILSFADRKQMKKVLVREGLNEFVTDFQPETGA